MPVRGARKGSKGTILETTLKHFQSGKKQKGKIYEALLKQLQYLADTRSQEDFLEVQMDVVKNLPLLVDFFCTDLCNGDIDPNLRSKILHVTAYMFKNSLYTDSLDDTHTVQLLSFVLKSSISCATIKQGNIVFAILDQCCETEKHHRVVRKALKSDIVPFLKNCLLDDECPEMRPFAFETLQMYYQTIPDFKELTGEWITGLIPLMLEQTELGLQVLDFIERIGLGLYKIPGAGKSKIMKMQKYAGNTFLEADLPNDSTDVEQTCFVLRVVGCFTYLCGQLFFKYSPVINKALDIYKKQFRNTSPQVRTACITSWKCLIDIMDQNGEEKRVATKKYLGLMSKPIRFLLQDEKVEEILEQVYGLWIYILNIQLRHIPAMHVFSEKYAFFFEDTVIKWAFHCKVKKYRRKMLEVVLAFLVHPQDVLRNTAVPERIYQLIIDLGGFQKYLEEWLVMLAKMATLEDPQYCQRGWTALVRALQRFERNESGWKLVSDSCHGLEDSLPVILKHGHQQCASVVIENFLKFLSDDFFSRQTWDELQIRKVTCTKSLALYFFLLIIDKCADSMHEDRLQQLLLLAWNKKPEDQPYMLTEIVEIIPKYNAKKTFGSSGLHIRESLFQWFTVMSSDLSVSSSDVLQGKIRFWLEYCRGYPSRFQVLESFRLLMSQAGDHAFQTAADIVKELPSTPEFATVYCTVWEVVLANQFQNRAEFKPLAKKTFSILREDKTKVELFGNLSLVVQRLTSEDVIILWITEVEETIRLFEPLPSVILDFLRHFVTQIGRHSDDLEETLQESVCSILERYLYSRKAEVNDSFTRLLRTRISSLHTHQRLSKWPTLYQVCLRENVLKRKSPERDEGVVSKKRKHNDAFSPPHARSTTKRPKIAFLKESQDPFAGTLENTFNVYEPSQGDMDLEDRISPPVVRRSVPQAIFPLLIENRQPISSLAPYLPSSMQLPEFRTIGELASRDTSQFTLQESREIQNALERFQDGPLQSLDRILQDMKTRRFSLKELAKMNTKIQAMSSHVAKLLEDSVD